MGFDQLQFLLLLVLILIHGMNEECNGLISASCAQSELELCNKWLICLQISSLSGDHLESQ